MAVTKACLLGSIATAALTAAPAIAQDAGAGAENADEIIVTARRQNERLIDVPASVAVLSAQTLERTGANSAEGFAQLTPGITIVTGTAEAGDTQINIRGINGARDAESSVALIVDGILKTNSAQLNQPQGTLRQIEILKGPQGAIYGRKRSGGCDCHFDAEARRQLGWRHQGKLRQRKHGRGDRLYRVAGGRECRVRPVGLFPLDRRFLSQHVPRP